MGIDQEKFGSIGLSVAIIFFKIKFLTKIQESCACVN